MKKQAIFFVVIIVFCYDFLGAQQIFDIKKLRLEVIDLPIAKEKLISQPITSFEILDARPDNSCLGFVKDVYPKEKLTNEPLEDYAALVFNKNFEGQLLQNMMPPKSYQTIGFNFFMAIKELWLYDNDNLSISDIGNQIDNYNTSGLLFRADVYMKRDGFYIPLFQIDSTFILRKTLQRSKIDLLQATILTLCNKINDFPVSETYNKAVRVKSKNLIDSFYNQINNIAFTQYTDTANQYIFPSFEDFKYGRSSKAMLRKFSDRVGDYYYNKEPDGKEFLIRSYAFFNKGVLFIKTNNTYSPTFLSGSRIYTLGSKLFTHTETMVPIFLPLSSTSYLSGSVQIDGRKKRAYQPMMIDMATGKVY